MIKIGNHYYKTARPVELFEDAGVRHIYAVIYNDIRWLENMEMDIAIIKETKEDEKFMGIIMLTHFCPKNNTTMFKIYVEE